MELTLCFVYIYDTMPPPRFYTGIAGKDEKKRKSKHHHHQAPFQQGR
jgi:hypothetical protein